MADAPLMQSLGRLRKSGLTALFGYALLALVAVWLIVNFAKDPKEFIQVGLIGLTNGLIFGLVALGYTLVYGILQLINFAHGDVFALSGLVASTMIVSWLGLDKDASVIAILGGMLLTLVVIMALFALVNVTIEFVAYRRLRSAPRLAALITAVGMSFIVQNVSLAMYDVNYRSVPSFIPRSEAFNIAGISYSWNKLAVVVITLPVLALLTWFVTSTKQGKAMRAVAQDTEASAMMGINVNRTISVTFAIAGALAGAAAIVYLLQFNMRYDTGFELGLIAFTAAVLGGIGNLSGAVVGALVIGFIQAFNEGLSWHTPGSDWTRSIVFGILIAILVFRPEGLLGERTPEGA
ncbi:MAG TPA: branched-chain amino acid ABC transporter permease [Gaiellaceae bacterium]|nr:branched-chain amino acid ABC transporter permease [Gaiellaceae bacterium]